MIKLNKDSNSPKMERASAPGVRASVTIEAAFAVPLFMFAVLSLIFLIEIMTIIRYNCKGKFLCIR